MQRMLGSDGLSGSIKTGCPATPAFKNQYCSRHVNHACELRAAEEDEELGVPTGTQLRASQTKKYPGNPVAEMILAKRTTRKHTYYQVR